MTQKDARFNLVCPNAELEWQEGIPFSKQFNDVYFQPSDGLAETQHVFLEANKVKEALENKDKSTTPLRIFETGFGSGLNFIATYKLWLAQDEPKKNLFFTSVEAYPLKINDLKQAASLWPDLEYTYQNLVDQYPCPIRGTHLLSFEKGRVQLRLIFDDIKNVLRDFQSVTDIWYLDGFAPSQNEEMWTAQLFPYMARSSTPNASVATFSAAGFIKRGLESVGFKVEKIKGFGRKREMITARFQEHQLTSPDQLSFGNAQPWHMNQQDHALLASQSKRQTEVFVIGAGIAGLCTALTHSRAGCRVKLIEKGNGPLNGASSQPQLILYGKFPKKPCPEAALLLHSQLHAQSFYEQEQRHSPHKFWHPVGVAQIAWNEDEAQRQKQTFENFQLPQCFVQSLTKEAVQNLAGVTISKPALLYPKAGWLDTKAFAAHVLEQDNIEFIDDCEITSLEFDETNQTWVITTNKKTLDAQHVVLCNADGAGKLIDYPPLPIKSLRGQTSLLESKHLNPPHIVLCGEGYLSPTESETTAHLGSTYDLERATSDCFKEDDQKNIEQLTKWLPGWQSLQDLDSALAGSCAGVRTTSSDYTPIVGRIPHPSFIEEFACFRKNANTKQTKSGVALSGLYLNVAYGSKGASYAPACADLIASKIIGRTSGHKDELQKMLHPARFIVRQLKRGK